MRPEEASSSGVRLGPSTIWIYGSIGLPLASPAPPPWKRPSTAAASAWPTARPRAPRLSKHDLPNPRPSQPAGPRFGRPPQIPHGSHKTWRGREKWTKNIRMRRRPDPLRGLIFVLAALPLLGCITKRELAYSPEQLRSEVHARVPELPETEIHRSLRAGSSTRGEGPQGSPRPLRHRGQGPGTWLGH